MMSALDFLAERYAAKLRAAVALDWAQFQTLVLALSNEDKTALLNAINAKDGAWMMQILWGDIEDGIQTKVTEARAQIEASGSVPLTTLETLIG